MCTSSSFRPTLLDTETCSFAFNNRLSTFAVGGRSNVRNPPFRGIRNVRNWVARRIRSRPPLPRGWRTDAPRSATSARLWRRAVDHRPQARLRVFQPEGEAVQAGDGGDDREAE